MKLVCNVMTQTEHDEFPRVVANVLNPDLPTLAKYGWFRTDGKEPEPSEGYRAVAYRYIDDMDTLTARKVIIAEVNIADEKAKAEADSAAAVISEASAASAALETQAADCVDSLTMRVMIALATAGTKLTTESAYIEARKQLGLK